MKITIISSSTRIDRISHRISLALKKQISSIGHEPEIIDLMELQLPRFSERYPNIEDKPKNWISTMNKLLESDGVIFVSPEYNGSFSSGLKNFIDVFAKTGFKGKPIGVATGSTGEKGGIRAAYQLQQVILSLFAYPQPEMLMVAEMQNKFDELGTHQDTEYQTQFESYVKKFLEFCSKLSNK
jgi:NAD(P)H-dependent FMN reductase